LLPDLHAIFLPPFSKNSPVLTIPILRRAVKQKSSVSPAIHYNRRMSAHEACPPTFAIEFRRIDLLTHRLTTSQVLPLTPEEIFPFFEDPGNLFEITPDWLDFRMAEGMRSAVFEGAEFSYTIKLFGVRIGWQSRITDYRPPERFVDIQLKGPYQSWHHLHTFEAVPEGTLMKDEVIYHPPLIALPLHGAIIKKRLENIFSYRALRVWEWARGEMKPKQGA